MNFMATNRPEVAQAKVEAFMEPRRIKERDDSAFYAPLDR
jgi:hypothetical protein